MKDAVLLGKKDIKLTSGSINANADIANASDIDVDNVTGYISFTLPSDSRFNIKGSITAEGIGGNFGGLSANNSITGGMKISQSFNGGKTTIKTNLVTGNINIDQK